MEDAVNLVKSLCQQLIQESIDVATKYEKEEEVKKVYVTVLEDFVNDYRHYRALMGDLLQTFERIYDVSVAYSLRIYLQQFEQVAKLPVVGHLDVDIVDEEFSYETVALYKRIVDEINASSGPLRLSELRVDTSWLEQDKIKSVMSLIINWLEEDARAEEWDEETAFQTFSNLVILHAVAKNVDQLPLYYHAMNIFFDAICRSGMPQQARDLAEEVLITAFEDKAVCYGFFLYCRVYSSTGNIQAALLYGNLFLKAIQIAESLPNTKFQYEIFWQSMKMMRDGKLYAFVTSIYDEIPSSVEWNDHEKRAIDLTYFTSLLKAQEPGLALQLSDYLGQHQKELINAGADACSRWLILLYNVRRLPQLFGSDVSGLDTYIRILESIVPEGLVGRAKDIVKGDEVVKLKLHLKQALLKLLQTRQSSDYVYDNEKATLIAHRIIDISFAQEDEEAVLLSMIVLSDYSVLIRDKVSPDLFPLDFGSVSVGDFYDTYPDPRQTIASLELDSDTAMVCLLAPEDTLYQFSVKSGKFSFQKLSPWSTKGFLEWSQNVVPKLSFATGTKDRHDRNVYYLNEDYLSQADDIKSQVSFPQIQVDASCNEVLLIKEIKLSALPHNLLVVDSEFLALSLPITNVLSVDWLAEKRRSEILPAALSKTAWFPLDFEDPTIRYLNLKIQNTLIDNNVTIYETTKMMGPVSSEINIIASHGADDISQTHHIFLDQDNAAIPRADQLIGAGSILILLVCHSGSARSDAFRNQVASLANGFLAGKYQAVIAPFWSLSIDIPPIWLNQFFNSFNAGRTLSYSVFDANKAVYDVYPTPTAWACMHLYGNPFCRMEPVVHVEE